MFKNKLQRRKGQGMTEYIIIVVLVAIAVLVAVRLFGDTVRGKFEGTKDRVEKELKPEG